MNIYHTETEQIEVIKQWFKKYGHWLSSTVLIILLLIAGFRLWEHHTLKIKSQASERYQELMVDVANDDKVLIKAQAKDLSIHYPQTIYAEAANLTQAKQLVSEKKWREALLPLNDIILKGHHATLRQIARLRAAKILCVFKIKADYHKALALLKTVDDISYTPSIDEMKGDIYLALKNPVKARAFYLKATKGFSKAGLNNPFLSMKLNEIPE